MGHGGDFFYIIIKSEHQGRMCLCCLTTTIWSNPTEVDTVRNNTVADKLLHVQYNTTGRQWLILESETTSVLSSEASLRKSTNWLCNNSRFLSNTPRAFPFLRFMLSLIITSIHSRSQRPLVRGAESTAEAHTGRAARLWSVHLLSIYFISTQWESPHTWTRFWCGIRQHERKMIRMSSVTWRTGSFDFYLPRVKDCIIQL